MNQKNEGLVVSLKIPFGSIRGVAGSGSEGPLDSRIGANWIDFDRIFGRKRGGGKSETSMIDFLSSRSKAEMLDPT